MTARFAAALFVSAALLFSIEPLVAKMITPLLGGAPAVWITCMLFFQAVLLAGYVYAHASVAWLGAKKQMVLHVVLLALPLLVLPIGVSESATGGWAKDANPVFHVLALLAVTVGLPFFALSTSAPVLQKWFSTLGSKDPYFLYGASNFGSVLALAAYPAVIETTLGLRAQSQAWRAGYLLFYASVLFCAVSTWRAPPVAATEVIDREPRVPVTWRRRAFWIGLAFVPSSALMGVTTYLTTDVAPIPLLWVLPLLLYLATFILVFAKRPPLSVRRAARLLPFGVTLSAVSLLVEANSPAPVIVALHLATFFLGAMVCHGRLADDRPGTEHLTEFFLWLSVGGVLGGLFNGLIAPALFDRLVEYPLALVLTALARPSTNDDAARSSDYVAPVIVGSITAALILVGPKLHLEAGSTFFMLLLAVPVFFNYSRLDRPRRFALGIGAFLLAGTLYVGDAGRPLHRERNFFGEIRVTRDRTKSFTQIVHGDTVHGRQSVDPAERKEPLAYYHRTGPLGQVFAMVAGQRTNQVAVVGLGAGAAAAYARPGERWTFYEINPAVVRIAQNKEYFSFLSDAFPAPTLLRIELGDARLRLAEAEDHAFNLLILDAFSSDSIPVHLLTREALRLYETKVAAAGVLAFHISNRYLDIKPELAELAHDAGLSARGRDDLDVSPELLAKGKIPSQWVAMAKDDAQLAILRAAGWTPLERRKDAAVWTDDFSNVLRAFNF